MNDGIEKKRKKRGEKKRAQEESAKKQEEGEKKQTTGNLNIAHEQMLISQADRKNVTIHKNKVYTVIIK